MATVEDVTNLSDFDKAITEAGSNLSVAHFWAPWAPQCQQMTDVLVELAKDTQYINCKFLKVEAEAVPEVSQKYEITAVPTCILLKNKKAVDRVNGANVPELVNKVKHHGSPLSGAVPPSQSSQPAKQDLNTRLKALINSAPVLLFMKGSAQQARCGFSKQMIQILNEQGVKFSTFDILSDDEVRQGLKTYSDWPTYPQLYVNGELLGGLDIVKELIESGEFKDQLPTQESLDDRLKSLIKKEKVMIFMKGKPSEPRCGFSKTLMGILHETGVQFGHFDILLDDEVRQGLKKYSDWPTYPQVYVDGELVGGLDIIKELQEAGDLESTLNGQ